MALTTDSAPKSLPACLDESIRLSASELVTALEQLPRETTQVKKMKMGAGTLNDMPVYAIASARREARRIQRSNLESARVCGERRSPGPEEGVSCVCSKVVESFFTCGLKSLTTTEGEVSNASSIGTLPLTWKQNHKHHGPTKAHQRHVRTELR